MRCIGAGMLEGDKRTRSQLMGEAWRTISARYGLSGDQHGQPRPLALLLIDVDTAAGREPDAGRHSGGGAGPEIGPRPDADADPGDLAGSGRPHDSKRQSKRGSSRGASSEQGDPDPDPDAEIDPDSDAEIEPAPDVDVVEVDGSGGEFDPGPDGLRVSEIVGHGPVAASTARRLLCDADISEITVTDGGKTVLDVGFTHRLATAAQRRALVVRSGGLCECPGCDAPYTWCQAHHLEPFDPVNQTGPTNLQNLVWLCHKHHHLVHEGGFHLIRGPTGDLELHRRDGLRVDLLLENRP